MRDVSRKSNTLRTAVAEAEVTMRRKTIELLKQDKLPKGDPLPVAKVAAIQAAKNTSQLIPYCHPLPIDFVGVEFDVREESILVRVEVKTIWKTGVEMEALAGASVAALTIYDMLKIIDGDLAIRNVRLISKTGGKSDFKDTALKNITAAVLVLSDSVASGEKQDTSGKQIEARLREEGITIADYSILPDNKEKIVAKLRQYADALHLDLVITTGGTGFGSRDVVPEAMTDVIEREFEGISDAIRSYGQERTPLAMMSRARAGQRGKTIIVNLPGSHRAVSESLDAIFPQLFHAFRMISDEGHPSDTSRKQKD